jgi:hypothetical protein
MGAKYDRYAPQMIADLCHDFGFADWQAAAFPGNAAAESGYFEDVVEDGALAKGWAGGTGWFQWTASRRRLFEAWVQRRNLFGMRSLADAALNSYGANYSFLYRELTGPERRIVARVKAAKTLEEATQRVCAEFERPAVNNYGPRIEAARRALERYRANPPKPTVWPTDPVKEAPMPVPTTPMPPVQAEPPAMPWYQSAVFKGAGGGALAAVLAAYLAYDPAKTFRDNLLGPFGAAAFAAMSAGWAALERWTATLQPLTVTKGGADKIISEQPPVAPVVEPASPPVRPAQEAWAAEPIHVELRQTIPPRLKDVPLGEVLEELPDILKRLAPFIPVLGQISAAAGIAADVAKRIENRSGRS